MTRNLVEIDFPLSQRILAVTDEFVGLNLFCHAVRRKAMMMPDNAAITQSEALQGASEGSNREADRKLFDRILANDPSAILQLFSAEGNSSIRILVDSFDYPDLPQDLFVHLFQNGWRYMRTWEGRSTLRSWIKTVAANLCKNRAKKVNKPVKFLSLDQLLEEDRSIPSPTHSTAHSSEIPFSRSDLLGALEKLTDRQRILIYATYVEGKTTREVAQLLGTTENNTLLIKHRTHQKIRELIEWRKTDV